MPRSKYHAEPTVTDGIRFASRAEANRYRALWLLQQVGAIAGLELQPRFDLVVNGIRVGFYKADFAYTDMGTSERVIEDVKGVATPVYRLKKRIVEALYGIEIREISA